MAILSDKSDYPLYLTKGETFRLKVVPKVDGVPKDLTGYEVSLNFRNGQFLTHTAPSDVINVDGSEVTVTLPSTLVALLLAHKPNYEIIATDTAFPAGFGDELLLAGRIKEN